MCRIINLSARKVHASAPAQKISASVKDRDPKTARGSVPGDRDAYYADKA